MQFFQFGVQEFSIKKIKYQYQFLSEPSTSCWLRKSWRFRQGRSRNLVWSSVSSTIVESRFVPTPGFRKPSPRDSGRKGFRGSTTVIWFFVKNFFHCFKTLNI